MGRPAPGPLVSLRLPGTGVRMESGAILPALGWYAEGYFFWAPLHAAAAKVLLALIVVHLALDGAAAWRLIARARATSPERDGGAPDECEAA